MRVSLSIEEDSRNVEELLEFLGHINDHYVKNPRVSNPKVWVSSFVSQDGGYSHRVKLDWEEER